MNFSDNSQHSLFPRDQNPVASSNTFKGKKLLAFLLLATLALSGLVFGGGWFLFRMYQTLPTLDQLENIEPPLSSKVMGKDGTLVYEFSIEKRSWVSLATIPDTLIHAVISIEDRKFYDHWGVDLKRIIGAMFVNLVRRHYAQGGSTLTQQLARNVYLSSQTSMVRKIREAMTAVQIESYYTKKEILELYLNQVYFGAGVYGVEAAARCYFNKPVSKIDLNECAVLAGVIQLPERFRPDRPANLKRTAARRGAVLRAMQKMHFIDEKAVEIVLTKPIPCNPHKDISQRAPYFVELVRQYAEQKYGDDALYNGGLTIYTTLDPEAQDSVEKAAADHLKDLQKKMNGAFLWKSNINQRLHISRENFLAHFDSLYNVYRKECEALPDSEHLRILQTAVVALDVKTGGVLALIGGRDFSESKFNRAIQAVRQPGSSFKPFLYTAAMEHGFAPSSLVMDQPITLQTPQGEWRPENYEGTFEGPVTIRHAVEHSLNLAAIQTIIQLGPDTVVDYARRMGLKQHLEPVPSLAIGSCEVIPLEMATAYSIFPNKGVKVAPFYVKRIVDRNGKILEEHEQNELQVLSASTAFIMSDVLTGVVRRGTGAAIPGLGFGRPCAGKTGTSNDYADAWFVGFTPQITCCVWVGVDERRSMGTGMTGAQAAVPIFARSMIALHKKLPVENFEKPDSVFMGKVCSASHKPAVTGCPQTFEDYFILGKLPDACDLHGPGKAKKTTSAKLFGPQEKHESKVPVKKRLTF